MNLFYSLVSLVSITVCTCCISVVVIALVEGLLNRFYPKVGERIRSVHGYEKGEKTIVQKLLFGLSTLLFTVLFIALIILSSMYFYKGRTHDFEVDGLYYVITSNRRGTVAVTYKCNHFYEAFFNGRKHYYSGTVVIPDTVIYDGKTYRVTEIGRYAFHGCDELTSVTIPKSVIEIGEEAFFECNNLEHCYCFTERVLPFGYNIRNGSPFHAKTRANGRITTLHVPATLLREYGEDNLWDLWNLWNLYAMNPWRDFGQIVAIGSLGETFVVAGIYYCILNDDIPTVMVMSGGANSYSGSVVIPGYVTYSGKIYKVLTIDKDAFRDCSGLTSVSAPKSVLLGE